MKLTDKPLKIEGDACGTRIVDSLYKVGDEYYFLDTGWPWASSHPAHPIGKLIHVGEDEWNFRDDDDRDFIVTPINDKDREWDAPMMDGYKAWKKYLKENAPDADGADFIRNDFQISKDIKIELVG